MNSINQFINLDFFWLKFVVLLLFSFTTLKKEIILLNIPTINKIIK